jgi:hypothetical protein
MSFKYTLTLNQRLTLTLSGRSRPCKRLDLVSAIRVPYCHTIGPSEADMTDKEGLELRATMAFLDLRCRPDQLTVYEKEFFDFDEERH